MGKSRVSELDRSLAWEERRSGELAIVEEGVVPKASTGLFLGGISAGISAEIVDPSGIDWSSTWTGSSNTASGSLLFRRLQIPPPLG
ncbi:hypothetical protein MA16_Dca021942 [Dendrobium catenatum]|uniref:Uncharacterized protein n=1 Tax=Dendrobium catenatum TaxID=906689 RepID=A0A2I0VG23_9ASPA|nr:hypothetical protein MA16_Dca021942 [Dendrobium catenatum]